MKLDRFVKHLSKQTKEGFRNAAENLGNELPRNRLWLLSEAIASANIMPQNEYAEGYLDAMRDIIAAYKSAVEANIRNMIEDTNTIYVESIDD